MSCILASLTTVFISFLVIGDQHLASILDYLHEHDPPVIHRDISPDNIILGPDGKLVLIDFGAANEYAGTATGTLIGKQAYIAPEQFKGKASPQCDIYALGACIFFLLVGEDPEPMEVARPKERRAEDLERL